MNGPEHFAAVGAVAIAVLITVVVMTAADLLNRLLRRFEFEDTDDDEEVTPCP